MSDIRFSTEDAQHHLHGDSDGRFVSKGESSGRRKKVEAYARTLGYEDEDFAELTDEELEGAFGVGVKEDKKKNDKLQRKIEIEAKEQYSRAEKYAAEDNRSHQKTFHVMKRPEDEVFHDKRRLEIESMIDKAYLDAGKGTAKSFYTNGGETVIWADTGTDPVFVKISPETGNIIVSRGTGKLAISKDDEDDEINRKIGKAIGIRKKSAKLSIEDKADLSHTQAKWYNTLLARCLDQTSDVTEAIASADLAFSVQSMPPKSFSFDESKVSRDDAGRFSKDDLRFKKHRNAGTSHKTVNVDLKKLDDAWKKSSYYLPSKGKGHSEVGGRREAFERFLDKGEDIESPLVTIDDDGLVDFDDGRHRFAVLRDMGVESIPVNVPKDQAEIFRKKFGVQSMPLTSMEFGWVTIGGKEEDGKKHAGGTPVEIGKGGVIDKGPQELKGKDVDDLGETSSKKNRLGPLESQKNQSQSPGKTSEVMKTMRDADAFAAKSIKSSALDKNQEKSLAEYQKNGTGYQMINGMLRGHIDIKKPKEKERIESIISQMDEAISKSVITESVTSVRGMYVHEDKISSLFKEGATFQDNGFVSSSLSLEASFAHDIFNRRAQGILNRSVEAVKKMNASARLDLEKSLRTADPAELSQALLTFIRKYRVQLADILTTTQLASLLEGAREVAKKIPTIPMFPSAPPPATLEPAKAMELLDKLRVLPVGEREQKIYELPADQQTFVRQGLMAQEQGGFQPPPPFVPLAPSEGNAEKIHYPIIDEAAQSLAAKNVMTRPQFDALDSAARQKAFTVAHVECLDTMTKIRDVMAEVVRDGVDVQTFRERVLAAVDEGTFMSNAHMECVLRVNVQTAFSDAQMMVLSHPFVRAGFPYAAIESIADDRRRHTHGELEHLGIQGTNIYRIDDPVFQIFRGPWDFNCRCGFVPMTVRMAASKGIDEAKRWLAEGIEPSPPEFVAMPSFRPPAGFQRSLSGQSLAIEDSSGHLHGESDGRFVKKDSEIDLFADDDSPKPDMKIIPQAIVKIDKIQRELAKTSKHGGLVTIHDIRNAIKKEMPNADRATVDEAIVELQRQGKTRMVAWTGMDDSLSEEETASGIGIGTYSPYQFVDPQGREEREWTRKEVEDALVRGKDIPGSVLGKHPDIAAKLKRAKGFSALFSFQRSLSGMPLSIQLSCEPMVFGWVTIGGHAQGDKKHVGGTPVQFDGSGTIQKGPAALKGKRMISAVRGKARKKQLEKGQSPLPAGFRGGKDEQPDKIQHALIKGAEWGRRRKINLANKATESLQRRQTSLQFAQRFGVKSPENIALLQNFYRAFRERQKGKKLSIEFMGGILLAQVHAPHTMMIGGKEYRGGEFIPGDVLKSMGKDELDSLLNKEHVRADDEGNIVGHFQEGERAASTAKDHKSATEKTTFPGLDKRFAERIEGYFSKHVSQQSEHHQESVASIISALQDEEISPADALKRSASQRDDAEQRIHDLSEHYRNAIVTHYKTMYSDYFTDADAEELESKIGDAISAATDSIYTMHSDLESHLEDEIDLDAIENDFDIEKGTFDEAMSAFQDSLSEARTEIDEKVDTRIEEAEEADQALQDEVSEQFDDVLSDIEDSVSDEMTPEQRDEAINEVVRSYNKMLNDNGDANHYRILIDDYGNLVVEHKDDLPDEYNPKPVLGPLNK